MKILTYSRYLFEYLKFCDWLSVWSAIRYVISGHSHSTDRIVKSSIGSFFCRKHTNDFQFANYYYEWGVKKFILDRKDEFSVFIDVGACVGDYCVLLSKMGKKCFAFELIPDNLAVLRKNLELNDIQDKVVVFPYGLGESNYETSFNFDPVNTGASRINRVRKCESQSASIRKLDFVMNEMKISRDENIVIKLDVEGMEAEVLRGGFKFIMSYPNLTFIVEEKHSGQIQLFDTFSNIARFEFGPVDEHNIYARKISNY